MKHANGRSILVVDDEILVLQLFILLLEQDGYCVSGASSGSAAVQALAFERFDLIVLDLVLPDMDGFEILRLVQGQTPYLKVIVTSGYCSDTISRVASHFGAGAVLQKPITPALFLHTVRELLVLSSE